MRKPHIYKSKGTWWCLDGFFKGIGSSVYDAYTSAKLARLAFAAS